MGRTKPPACWDEVKELEPEDSVWIGNTEVETLASRIIADRCRAVACGLRSAYFLTGLNPDAFYPRLKPRLRLIPNPRTTSVCDTTYAAAGLTLDSSSNQGHDEQQLSA